MTSGVKQVLPQVLMPKAGAGGKGARNPAQQSGFAEALGGAGKSPQQPGSAEVRSGWSKTEATSLWQRLAAKLETAAGHAAKADMATGQTAKLDIATADAANLDSDRTENPEKQPAGDRLETQWKDDAAGIVARQGAHAPLAPMPPASPPAEAIGQARRDSTSARAELPIAVRRNAIGDGLEASAPTSAADLNMSRPAAASSPKAPPPPTPDVRDGNSAGAVFVPLRRGGEAEPIGVGPAARPAAAPSDRVSADRAKPKDAMPEASADAAKAAPRATLLAQQSIPAPMPSTAIVLAESLAGGGLLEPARNVMAVDAIHLSATHASAQSLKIQLHPAELGIVTATLRFAGEQLSIEIQVENHEAYRHLSDDSDTIVGALRDLGYEVDRVTVLQPQLASSPAGRSDSGSPMPSFQGRGADQSGSGAAGANNGGSGGRQPSDGENSGRDGQHAPAASREQQGGGLYI